MAANTTIPDEAGEFDDWIELYNGGSTAIDINGYFLSDDINNPLAVQIDTSVIIAPGGFILLWADKDPEQGKFHLDFKLSAGGEQISLASPTGVYVDSLTYGPQADNISYGRFPDGSNSFFFFDDPTPDGPNSASGNIDKVGNPVYNTEGGIYNNTMALSLSTTTPGAQIYYTLDGADPDQNSTLYTGAFNVTETTVVRAKAFLNNYFPSDIISHTYFINETYTLPVVSIVTDPDNMFGTEGIYTNPTEGGSAWERYCQVQYFKNNNLDFSIDCGIRIQGSSSVGLPKKSFRLFFDEEDYGQARLEYPMFEGSDVTDFKNLVLRAGYDDDITDENGTLLRDPFGNRVYKESGGLITEGNWAILTINGEYWGIYEVRESMNDKFVESHTGWNDFDMVRFQKFDPELRAGTWDDWDFLRDFLENNDLSDDANYAQAEELIDIDNLVNLLAFIQCSSYDSWSFGVNTFKENVPGGKWQYTIWDMDRSFFSTSWDPHDDYDQNGPTTWSNFFNEALTENETFRNKLVNRVADLLNTTYLSTEATSFLNGIKLEIEAEIPGEYERWNDSEGITEWNENITRLNEFLEERPDVTRSNILDYYSFSGTNTINLDKEGEGRIKLNTIDVPGLPWTGIYFEEVPVPIQAIAAPGYIFAGWSDPSLPNEPNVELLWDDTYDLTAYFVLGSTTVADVVINEINYNSLATNDAGDWIELYNASGTDVNISGWTFKDSSLDYFNLPANTILPAGEYLILVEDSVRFQTVYPGIDNFIGDFGDSPFGNFKLSGAGEFISFSNADVSYRDTVLYDDKLPWPVAADGSGFTLQLIAPTLDNALPESWEAKEATPASLNNVQSSQTINFSPIPDKFTNDLPFEITAIASSGLPVNFNVISGPASISGNTITLDGTAGTIIVLATQLGNGSYLPAPSQQQSFEVNLQSQTISFGTIADKFTTDTPFSITATTSSGLAAEYSIVSGPASVTGNVITLDGVGGTVLVQADQPGNGDYLAASSVQQSFEVNLQSQTISFGTIDDKFTTDTPFSITGTTSSGLAVEYSIVSGPASVSGNVISLDGVGGTVLVQADQPGNGDYLAASSVQQSFEVNLQSQTISFETIDDKFTTDIPFSITGTTSSGLAVEYSIVSGPASVSGNVITLDGVGGTVLVQADQPGNGDYLAASSVQQSFEVNLQSQTISFETIADKFTTDTPFSITGTTSSGLAVEYSIVSGPASVSGNVITLDGVGGTVVVQAGQSGNGDYLPASSVQQSFEVNLQSQTISFEAIDDKFTTDNPFSITGTTNSGLAVEYSIVSGPASVTGNVITLDGVGGTVVVQADQSGNGDYLPASSVQQTFDVNLQTQAIDFPVIPNKLTTDGPFSISANSSSGLAVSFTIVSGPANLSGTTITLDGVEGSVVVQADQAGDGDYLPAISVQRIFEVTEEILIDQSIDFLSIPDKITTDVPFDVSAISSSGLPVEFSIASGPASISGNTITLDGIGGTVVVQANQGGNADYYPAQAVQQSFEVNLQNQTISFEMIGDKLTTDVPFTIAATSTSGLGVSFSIVSGPASILGNVITLDGVSGSVVVQADQFGNADYNPALSVQQTFLVGVQNQVISFDAISDKLTTDAPFAITATSTSGLGVSFSIVSGPASVSGNTITLDGVGGTVVVQADQSGNTDFNPASSVQQSFEVNLQNQVITFDAIGDKLTTDAPFMATASSTSGLGISFSIVSGPASVSGNTITLDGVGGTVVVQANQSGNTDFNPASSVQQSFEVNLQNQVITFDAISDKITTDAPFMATASSTSGLGISFSIVSGPASVSGNTITLDGVGGTVVVQADQSGNIDFNPASSVQQSFEVNLQNQIITFDAISDKITTDAPFMATASSTSGLGINFSIVSGPASVSGNTITLDGTMGTVIVRASQSGNDTYSPATDVEQTFEVELIDAIIETELADPMIKAYPNPVNDLLYVELNAAIVGAYELLLYDHLGRLVHQEALSTLSTETQVIEVNTLATGMYTLTVLHESKLFFSRFVKSEGK